MKRTFASLVAISMLAAMAQPPSHAEEKDPLNSFIDQPAKCDLKPEERKWLLKAFDNGELRLATEEDKRAWEELAKSKKRRINKLNLDCGRTYTVLKPILIPGKIGKERFSGDIAFIVSKGTVFPHLGLRNGAPIYDLNTGGWLQLGEYDDGINEGKGFFPTSTQKTWK